METLHAPCYADGMQQQRVAIAENVRLAKDTWRLRFLCPPLAEAFVPGQFLMLRVAGCDDPLIARPLALYDTVLDAQATPVGIDVVYLVKGKLTKMLSRLVPGQMVDVWGPLGNGFPRLELDHLIMVAGGIGQTPMLALARQYLGRRHYGRADAGVARAGQVTFCYGARTSAYFAGLDDFQAVGCHVRLSTDDGSAGRQGLVTQLLAETLQQARGAAQPAAAVARTAVMCCGPEPMMQAVTVLCQQWNVACYVSLETPMACGIGICFTCVARIRDDSGQWDYRRTCVEGPVFEGRLIAW